MRILIPLLCIVTIVLSLYGLTVDYNITLQNFGNPSFEITDLDYVLQRWYSGSWEITDEWVGDLDDLRDFINGMLTAFRGTIYLGWLLTGALSDAVNWLLLFFEGFVPLAGGSA